MTESSVDTNVLQVKGVTMAAQAFRHCIFILDELLSCYDCFQFLAPVPLTAVVYHTEIKYPMDFNTLENNLYQNKYKEYKDFEQDLCLIWNNAKLFHRSFDMIYQQAENLYKRYMSLEDFVNGGPKPFYLASPESDLEGILNSPLPEEKMTTLVKPEVVFPMYKELDPPNKSNLYFVQALSEQDCATKKLRGFSNVRLLFQHLNASFFKYMSEPQPASVPLPRFYIAKNRTLLNGAGVDPDGALAILYNVQIKPFIKGLFQLQATVVISEPMGETHGFDESSMDKSNEYEFCPKGWVKLRVIKVVENVNAVIDADMDRSYFKKVYSTYKLSTRIPADPKKVGDKEIAKTFVQAILNPVSSSPSALTVPKPKPATASAAAAITPKATSSKKAASPAVTPSSRATSTTPVRQSRSRSTSGQARSASPVVAKDTSLLVAQDESKIIASPVRSRTPSATLKKRVTNKSTPSATNTNNTNSLPSSPTIKKVTTPLKENPKSQSIPLEDATPVSALRDNASDSASSRTTEAVEDNTADKPMIRIKFKPKVISHDNDDDDAMEVEETNNKDDQNGYKSDESESESEEDTLRKDKKDEKRDDDDDDSDNNGKGASGDNHRKEDGDSDDGSVDDDSSNGSSSPPPEAEEWFTDGDEDSMHSARDRISYSSPPPPPPETSVALERFPSSATTSSSQTDNTESQLQETNVSFERYMDDVTANGIKEESGSKSEAIKQYYIDASKELWEKLRSYALEQHVTVVDINTYAHKTSSFPNAEGFFKHVYFLKEDSQKVIQTFRRMTITQRATEIVSLLALKGLPRMGQITEVLQESHGEIIGLSMQRYQKTLKQYTHAHSHHRLTAHQKMDLVIQMLECMETIHKIGLAHRDLSEVNFMVNETTEKLRDGSPRAELFLIDFGKSVFTNPEDVRRWWIEHPKYLNDEYDGEVVPLTKEDLVVWCQQLPWIRSKPDHGYRLYRSVQTLPKSRTDTEDLPWLINPIAEDMYSIGTIIWKTFSETEPWYGILDTDLKGLRDTVSEDYHIERALDREVSGILSKKLLLKFLKISPEQRSTATEVLAWLKNLDIQDALIAEWKEYAPVGRQKRHAKTLFKFEEEQAGAATATAATATTFGTTASTQYFDQPQRKKLKTSLYSTNDSHTPANSSGINNSSAAAPLVIHIPPSLSAKKKETF